MSFAQSQTSADDRGSLSWWARQAQQSGKATITIPAPDALTAQPESLEAAITHTSLVVAKVVATETAHTEYTIETWRKYLLVEKLSSQPIPGHGGPLPKEVPASFLPLAPDEFVMAQLGGTVTLNGITITMLDSGARIAAGPNHLMFVMFFSSGFLAKPNYGMEGMFSVDEADNIHAWIDSDSNKLGSELLSRTGKRLSSLRNLAAVANQSVK